MAVIDGGAVRGNLVLPKPGCYALRLQIGKPKQLHMRSITLM